MHTPATRQRRHVREAMSVTAWLRFRSDRVPRTVSSLDTSVEGARFASVTPLPEGARVLVALQAQPGDPVLECKGKVCWCLRKSNGLYEYGVRFMDLGLDEQGSLALCLSHTHGVGHAAALAVV
jgi:hypothetical protein